MYLPKELERSVEQLIESQEKECKQKEKDFEIKKLKNREKRQIQGSQLIEEIKSLTGLDCIIKQELIDEEVEIIFECKQWGTILSFKEA